MFIFPLVEKKRGWIRSRAVLKVNRCENFKSVFSWFFVHFCSFFFDQHDTIFSPRCIYIVYSIEDSVKQTFSLWNCGKSKQTWPKQQISIRVASHNRGFNVWTLLHPAAARHNSVTETVTVKMSGLNPFWRQSHYMLNWNDNIQNQGLLCITFKLLVYLN